MHPPEVLKSIYQEHGQCSLRMAGTLASLDVPARDVELLSLMPWPYPANRIAVERERLDPPAVHPLLHWKLPPPPPDWLTPALVVKLLELALYGPGEPPPGCGDEDEEDFTDEILILPA